jgi:hypothetical protein
LNPLGWSLQGQSPERPRRALTWLVGLVLLLGLPVGLYQSPLMVLRRWVAEDGPLGVLVDPLDSRARREAAAGLFLRYELPADAVVQAHWDVERLELPQIARQQIGVMVLERDTMVFYPAEPAAHAAALREVGEVLGGPATAQRCRDVLAAHRITHVLVGSVERALWRALEKFDDERYFDCLFRSAEARVYALRHPEDPGLRTD